MKLLAGLEVTTKAVKRTAEAIGADITASQQAAMNRALQLDLPIPIGPRLSCSISSSMALAYRWCAPRPMGGEAKIDSQPAHTREAKLGCVFTQTPVDEDG